jgi:hypothetical protein
MTINKGMRNRGETQNAMRKELAGSWANSKKSDPDYFNDRYRIFSARIGCFTY